MIHSFEYCVKHTKEIGLVVQSREFIVKVSGIDHAVIGEGITFETEQHGSVLSIEHNAINVLLLSKTLIKPKTRAVRTGSQLTVSSGEGLLGHVVNALGHSITTRRFHSNPPEKRIIDTTPIGLVGRKQVSRCFPTGVILSDLLIPLGYGQRELIIGDRKTGKTHFAQQVMISQAQKGSVCIYCAIGKRKTEIKNMEEFLEKNKIMERSLIVAADSNQSPGEIFLAPYTAMTLAEYFRDHENDVFLILDDLTTHAKYYREISLLAGYFPGRESYPGDIFHVHSKLLERAGCFDINGKQVTITCFPIAESIGGDITGYIQTNLMSITDGHIFFDNDLFYQGRRPPINIFLSVTRIGRQTQSPLMRDVGAKLIKLIKSHDDIKRYLRFGPELSEEIGKRYTVGENLIHFFDQIGFEPIPVDLQLIFVSLIWLGSWEKDKFNTLLKSYNEHKHFHTTVTDFVKKATTFEELIELVKKYFHAR